MTTEDFIREFELLADAPNGVKILREMVLQLAVQGKLVEQDPGDEPTIHLLEDVDSERKRLADKGLIKKSKKLKAISEEEHPYLLPSGWEWVRLRQITNDCGQKVPDDDFTYIDVGSIDKERGVISKDVQILTPADAPSRARKLVMPNTVIYSTVRPYLLNIAVIDRDFTPSPIVSTAFFVLHPLAGISSRFIYHYLRSQIFIDYVNDAMTGMAYPAVNDSKMSVGLMPLPPLAEQKRIVAKVDELMRLCDELEEQQTKKNQTRVTLNASCLHALTSPSSNSCSLVSISGSSSPWSRISDNFDILYNNPKNVSELRKTILQLAVQGRLVPQDPNDEPASELLKNIVAEKDRLITEGKIRKPKPLPVIDLRDVPYTVPQGWKWARLDNTIELVGGCAYKSHSFIKSSNNQVLRLGNVKNDKLLLEANPVFIADKLAEDTSKYQLKRNDILITMTGTRNKADYGFTTLVGVHAPEVRLFLNQRVGCIRCIVPMQPETVNIFLKSQSLLRSLLETETGTANQGNIGSKVIRELLFPLPPLAEQKRIVTKVNELMRLCDELETGLLTLRQDEESLMASVVNRMCGSGSDNL